MAEDILVPGAVAEQDINDLTGATVFKGGAPTFLEALDTVAHEVWHLQPRNIKQWMAGGVMEVRAETHAQIKASQVVDIWKGKQE